MKSSKKILEATANFYEISLEDIIGRRRTEPVAKARQVGAYLLRELLHFSFPYIGRKIGGRDHTTAIYSYKKIAGEVDKNPSLRRSIDHIIEMIGTDRFSLKKVEHTEQPIFKESHRDTESSTNHVFETSEELLLSSMNKDISSREREILGKYRDGITLNRIAEEVRVSRERIRQIVNKTLLKEIAQRCREGYSLDIKEYIKFEKEAHQIARDRISEKIQQEILSEIPNFIAGNFSINDLSKKYGVQESTILKMPEFEEILVYKKREREKKWSKQYIKCRACGTVVIPHLRRGFCENCVGIFRSKKRREAIIRNLNSHCVRCGIVRGDAVRKFGRDLYISRDKIDRSYSLFCRGCFNEFTGKKMTKSRGITQKKL